MDRQFHNGLPITISEENERLTFDSSGRAQKPLDYKLHLLRYAFASQFIENKKTLDVACGNGYGSSYLMRYRPKIVVGMDSSKEAIEEGRRLFDNELLELLVGDATNMGFKDCIFDVVVSFETIEHIKNYARFLNEVRRILKNNGVLIISTPNKDAFSGYNRFYYNRFHVKEFTVSEFYSVLHGYFGKVDLYGETQIGIMYKILRDIRRILVKRIGIDLLRLYWLVRFFPSQSDLIYSIRTAKKTMPKFLIAVCRNKVHNSNLRPE